MREHRLATRVALGEHRVAVEPLAGEPLELGQRIEPGRARRPADHLADPRPQRQMHAMFGVQLLPGAVGRALGVVQKSVEVQQQRPDHAGSG